MNPIISARIIRLFSGQELLASRMLRIADEFGLKITKSDIDKIITSINTSEVPDWTRNIPSDGKFLSILVYIYVQSHITFPICTEKYLNYLDRIFQYKCKSGRLRVADIFFYEVFTDRMSDHR